MDALVESNSAQGVLVGEPDEILDEARTALSEGLGPWHDGTGIALPGGFMLITASAADRAQTGSETLTIIGVDGSGTISFRSQS